MRFAYPAYKFNRIGHLCFVKYPFTDLTPKDYKKSLSLTINGASGEGIDLTQKPC